LAQLPADADFVHFAEAELAGAIGSASARVMVASVAQEEDLGLEEVLDILDEATQVRAYSRSWKPSNRNWKRRPPSCAGPTSACANSTA
jgi:hypothetical protein